MRNFTMFSCFRSLRALSQMAMFALFLFLAMPARSQEVTAAVNGTVTDPSGAAVANAKVTVKDLDRGTAWPTTTNDGGFYILPRLPIGRYEVRVENPGFQASVQSPVQLQLNQSAKIDFQLTGRKCERNSRSHVGGSGAADAIDASRHDSRC